MNDLRAKLAALFRHAASPDINDEEAVAALREFRALGCTPREINEALGAQPPKPMTLPVRAAAPVQQPTPSTPKTWPFTDPPMPFGKHAGKRLSVIEPGYLRWLQQNTELKPWLRSQIEQALAGAKAAPTTAQPAQAAAPPDASSKPSVPF